MKTRNIVLWLISVLIALLMVFAGSSKVTAKPEMVAAFANYGFGAGFLQFIGICEILGGIGVLIPRTRFWAATLLIPILIGAVWMHLTHNELSHLPIPAVFLVLCAVESFMRRDEAGRIFAKGGLLTGAKPG
jgi:putative oxidoreductase